MTSLKDAFGKISGGGILAAKVEKATMDRRARRKAEEIDCAWEERKAQLAAEKRSVIANAFRTHERNMEMEAVVYLGA